MDGTIQAYVLDMAADTKKEPLRVKQYDTNSRQARITLKMGGEPWTIPFGCQIYINVRKTDGKLADATCTREDEHTVLAPITEQMTAVTGTQLGELYFLGSDGDIKTQTFPVVVYEAVMDQARIESSDDFQSLQEALRDVKVSTEAADIAAQYATEQGNSARDGAQRANDAADSIQVAVDAAANAKACESNAKNSELAAAQTQQEVTDYVEAQKAAFVGYSQRESDSKYANALTETAMGEGSITVEDAWTAPVLGLDVAGKSEQVQTMGKNLFDTNTYVTFMLSKNDANNTVNRKVFDGRECLYINGSLVSTETVLFSCSPELVYTISYDVYVIKTTGTASGNGFAFARENEANLNALPRYTDVGKWTKITLVTTTGCLYVYPTYGSRSEQYIDINSIQIEVGNIVTEYEPYTGGAPSPSPDYPQDIISTGTVSTGAQLLNLSKVPDQVDNNVTSYKYTDGGLTCVFSAKNYGVRFKVSVQPNTIYTISSLDISTGGYLSISDFLQSDKSGVSVLINKGQNSKTFNSGTATELTFTMYSADDNYLTVVTRDIMLNTGDTALPWEPYTGGKPSPSVEYPQTLEVTATGANLLKYPYGSATMTINGVTFTDNGDGTITANGTATQNAYYYLDNNSGNAHNVLGKNVWLSGCPAGGSLQTYVLQWFNYDGSLSAARDFGKGINFTVSKASANNYNIVIVIMAGVTANNLVFRPMLNNGDTTLPWEPYQNKSASITLTESLRGIGEYRDRIMCRDGVWGIERNVQLQKLNANNVIANSGGIHNENAIIDGRYTTILCADYANQIRKSLYGGSNLTQGFCNIAPAGKTTEWNITSGGKDNIYTINLSSSIYISVPISVIGVTADATAEEVNTAVKQYVVDNDVYVMFIATPTWEPFPDATQQALNALTTYTGTTHLTITAGGPAPTVTLDYVQDTHKALEQCQEAAKEYTDNQLANIVAALPTATQAAIVDNQTTRLLQEV